MTVNAQLFSLLSRDTLRDLADTFDVAATDRRSAASLRAALLEADLSVSDALPEIPLPALQAACAAAGVAPGRSRADAEARLRASLMGASTLGRASAPRAALTAPLATRAPPGPAAPRTAVVAPLATRAPPGPAAARTAVAAPHPTRALPPAAAAAAPRPQAGPTRRAFVALDFETADSGRDSACQVAAVRVEAGVVVSRAVHFIRPPRPTFAFTWVHGITWEQVRRERSFAELWPTLAPIFEGAAFIAAHNASFDRSVLNACCAAAGVPAPAASFVCTVQLARQRWALRPTKLPDVCRHLGIPLRHHDAASDAEACARIVLAAEADRVGA